MSEQYARLVTGLALSLACPIAAGLADDKKAPPAKSSDSATGSVADETLAKKAPAAGLVVTKKGWDELLKAWGVMSPFDVDFDKQLVVVATNQGSTLTLTTAVDAKGDLTVKVLGEADIKPGFRYAFKRLDRAGIQTVKGKPLPKE